MEIVSIEAGVFEKMSRTLDALIQNARIEHGKQQKKSLTDWIDNQDVCLLMDISPRKLLTLRRTGAIPYTRIDRKIYYRERDIILYMEKELQKGNI